MRLSWKMCLTFFAAGSGLLVQASTIYDEAVQGDLSNSGLSPTPIALTVGSNQVLGTTGNSGSGIDRDYFTVVVPAGFQMTGLIELAGTSVGGNVSFLGLQSGSQFTVPPNTSTAAGLLGWTHYGPVTTDTDILPALSMPNSGSSGFTAPLNAGNYSFWIQDFNSGRFSYGFDLVLAPAASPAPEPASYATVLGGCAALIFLRKKRQAHSTKLLQEPNNSSRFNA